MPERRGRFRFGIEGVHAVAFGSDENNIVYAFAQDRKARNVQRLGIDIAVHVKLGDFSEPCSIDVCGR
jgi:hypothetical protein